MTLLNQLMLSVEVGAPSLHRNLSMFPLASGCVVDTPEYLLLDEALTGQTLVITEVSEQGAVPELALTNNGDQPVLLLDGEELIGAKQNRVLNLTILAPANATIRVPVSCVEAGRWSYESAAFRSAPHAQYARGRAARVGQVSACLRETGRRDSDQFAVWEDIALKSERMGSRSRTGAMRDIFENHASEIEEYVRHFRSDVNQCGAVFAIAGEVVGLEIFDCPATFSKVLPKLIRSYALDAVEVTAMKTDPPRREAVDQFIAQVMSAKQITAKAVGTGTDIRLNSEILAGGALVADDRIIHLYAFRVNNNGATRSRSTRITRASRRARR